MLIGYARVSTADQDLALETDALMVQRRELLWFAAAFAATRARAAENVPQPILVFEAVSGGHIGLYA